MQNEYKNPKINEAADPLFAKNHCNFLKVVYHNVLDV